MKSNINVPYKLQISLCYGEILLGKLCILKESRKIRMGL
jgi:hypothetical protein